MLANEGFYFLIIKAERMVVCLSTGSVRRR